MRPTLDSYPRLAGGKVRDLHVIDDRHLLLVASDRISAYDHVLSTPIPDKGRVLTAMSVFWFGLLDAPNHLAGDPDDPRIPESLLGRALVVDRLRMVPIECVARGHLTGSGKTEYDRSESVCGVPLPPGLVEASALPEPIFTPASKAELGDHDENITFEQTQEKVGETLAARLRDETLAIYSQASEYARGRGIILADTKFEFGLDGSGSLILADEVLTPDSSRFWPADGFEAGRVQPSFDKQYVRDWLTGPESGWDRSSDTAPPPLPEDVVAATRTRYIEAYERISGLSFDDWLG
ncbi:phosphoribosylaminoimidazolesuccinocarboxamide synthase [Rhodococcus rhodnii]|uniref:Phosphoribosylaminoimidazole-succinocarboxamide synthase n=2 Tax=Rhodococcus rhodnii TaxID=38312 RepID=R7WH51_9NOCA|nr:phosphoribosylaminoimidazolesuccinocarboxamide synthase [Rhodococcus rhodnii]EOM74423.1 phosphoribosylaminoimidazole-succinocarboxamide [Rhodococcus rhodnii LMG 5362]TXG89132.1 phosphoribosylaminoimidazolesuccinocarboxamide synthase [Rhodococcus rhodnii]